MRSLGIWVTLGLLSCGPQSPEWLAVDTGASAEILAVHGTSSNDVYAVGEQGVIRHWNGTGWSTLNTATNKTLNAVWAVSPGEVWVGGDYTLLKGSVMTGFSAVPNAPLGNIKRIWATGPRDVYFLMYDTWHRYDGTSFIELKKEFFPSSISGSSSAGIWLVVKGNLKQLRNGNLEDVNVGYDSSWNYVSVYSATDIWLGNRSVLLHYDGQSWATMNHALNNISVAHAVAPRQAWVGSLIEGRIAFHDGTSAEWSVQANDGALSVQSFWSPTPNDVWASVHDFYGPKYLLRRFVTP